MANPTRRIGVVLSGDTRFSENLVQFAQGTDVLIHEGDAGASGTGFQPGEAETGGLFSRRAVRCSRPGGSYQKNLFRTAGSGRGPDEH